jgi:putative membrane protein
MISVFKALHVTAVAIWAAGLLALPFLFLQRVGMPAGARLDALHRLVRFLYVNLMSRAAFVAIGTGVVIIFLRQTWVPWFSLKLLMVACLVLVHVLSGLLILKLFEPGESYSRPRCFFWTATNLAVVTSILFLVLAKPVLLPEQWFGALFEPGALGRFARELIGRAT